MGKRQHSRDKLHITRKEWSEDYGGKKSSPSNLSILPYYCCSLDLLPFKNPVCTSEGTLFDIENIIPYIKQYNKHPITGEPLTVGELIKLNFYKNNNNEYHCPVTFKIFNSASHIVAIATSGNVYSFDAIEQLNIKGKNWNDLLTGEKFNRSQIITLQDPQKEQRNVASFDYIKNEILIPKKVLEVEKINTNLATESAQRAIAEVHKKFEEKKAFEEIKEFKEPDPKKSKLNPTINSSSSRCAPSFTSTSLSVITSNDSDTLSDEAVRENRYKEFKRKKSDNKGYVRLTTSAGNINLELDISAAPRTCHNFLTLCSEGYYNGVIFHRLIPGFMIQGGDPTGTGRGGQSKFYGKKMPDEIGLIHERGVISMANSGTSTNGSQFFLTFKSCYHLDSKHSVFGKIVGGSETLDAMERYEIDSTDCPKKTIAILETVVYTNPFAELTAKELKAQKDAEIKRLDSMPHEYYSTKIVKEDIQSFKSTGGVGKYINPSAVSSSLLSLGDYSSKNDEQTELAKPISSAPKKITSFKDFKNLNR